MSRPVSPRGGTQEEEEEVHPAATEGLTGQREEEAEEEEEDGWGGRVDDLDELVQEQSPPMELHQRLLHITRLPPSAHPIDWR